jgi:type I restriction enzyme S subunit
MSWQTVRLGDICTIEKGTTGINKAVRGEYPLVVTSEERKSHNEYQFDDDAVIIPLVSSTGHGHKSLKRIHFQQGKFALGSILCAVIPKDKTVLHAEYLYRYLDLNRENELVSRMKGMANVTLPLKEIAQIPIPVPSIQEQIGFIGKFKYLENCSEAIGSELGCQLSFLKKLRQQILQDAVQGKLVPQNPNDEPASVLLKRIKTEKEQLIREKKIRPEKPLPAIKPEEVPFEIPESWVWCRLGEIAIDSEAGKSFKAKEECANENQIGIIKTSAITSGFFIENENKLLPNQEQKIDKNLIKKDDLLFCRASGSTGLAGKSCLVVNTLLPAQSILR